MRARGHGSGLAGLVWARVTLCPFNLFNSNIFYQKLGCLLLEEMEGLKDEFDQILLATDNLTFS